MPEKKQDPPFRGKKVELTLDVVEMVIVAFFAAFQWSSTIPLFPVYSRAYWFLFVLTVAYLIVLLIKFYWKYREDFAKR